MVFIIVPSWCCELHRTWPTQCCILVWSVGWETWTATQLYTTVHTSWCSPRDHSSRTMLHRLMTVSVLLRLTRCCSLSSSETVFEARECSAEHVKTALEETCSCVPRPVVVRLPWPNNTEVHHMTPTHVEVNNRPRAHQEIAGVLPPNYLPIFLAMTHMW